MARCTTGRSTRSAAACATTSQSSSRWSTAACPGREDSQYYGDHYVIITGLMGNDFLYNDPIGGRVANESPGYDRMMTAGQLQAAMHASDTQYAFSAFGLSKN